VQKNCFAAEDVEIERKISLVRREQRLAQFYDIKGGALIKKKIQFSSYIRTFGMEQLQSHI
jgi:hypothetical protein